MRDLDGPDDHVDGSEVAGRTCSQRPPGAGGDMPCLRGVRVLLVEDEPDSRDLLTQVLAHAGAEVRSSSSAAEALAEIDRELPDVLVSDIGLPEQDGYDLIAQVRGRADAASAVPAVALTGYASERDRARVLAAGYQLHVAKPVEPDELAAAVAWVARRRRRWRLHW